MVGVVVVDLRLQPVEGLAEIGLLEAQPQALTLELAAVHPAPGIACVAIAATGGQLDQGVRIRRPAQGDVGVPLVVTRWHGIAVAIGVIVSLGAVGHQPGIALTVAGGGVQVAVEATVGGGQQAAVEAIIRPAELLRLALEEHGGGRGTWPPEDALRPFDDRELVEGVRADVRARRIHAIRAGAEHLAAVGEQFQARAEHAAEHRIAVDAAVTHGGKAGNGLQVVGTVAGRHRLTGNLGVGHHGQWGLLADAGNDHRRQFNGFGVLRMAGMLSLRGQCATGEHSQQRGMGELPTQAGWLNRKTLRQARSRRTAMSNAGHKNFHFCM